MNDKVKETIDIFSEDEFFTKIICENVDHARNCRDLLRRKGIRNCHDILFRDNFDSIPKWIIAKVLRGIDKFGYRRLDCSVEKYPEIDDYFRECFKCQWCGASLNNNESNTQLLLCGNCSKRHERLWSNKNLDVHLEVLDEEEVESKIKGIITNITLKNNTRIPLTIKLNNCVLAQGEIQSASDDTEDVEGDLCILPDTQVALRKTWSRIEQLCKGGYFIVSFVDKTFNKQYTYKFARNYRNHDYWEVDLNNPQTE